MNHTEYHLLKNTLETALISAEYELSQLNKLRLTGIARDIITKRVKDVKESLKVIKAVYNEYN